MTATRTRWLVQFAKAGHIFEGKFLALSDDNWDDRRWTGRPELALQYVDPIALAQRVRTLMPHAAASLRLVALTFTRFPGNPPQWFRA